jgi:hypothetical protein
MWATFPRSASSIYHPEFHEGYYQKHTNPLNCRTSSSDISGYYADFKEGHGAVGEWQGHGMAGARHRICELAFKKPLVTCRYVSALSCVHLTASLMVFQNQIY